VLWCSKLQTEIALSTAEAEYIALSSAARELICFMRLLTAFSFIFELHLPRPKVHSRIFEDNQSCIAIAESNKFSPRTKHIGLKYHHFGSFVKDKLILFMYKKSLENLADLNTKILDESLFLHLCKQLCGC
jgi:hypothetical protein